MKKLGIYLIPLFFTNVTMGSELTTAIQNTNISLAQQLIIEKKDINTQDKWGWTPLMWAASKGDLELCKILITNGAAVDVKDKDGATILDFFNGQSAFGLKPDLSKQIFDLLTEARKKQAGQLIAVDSTALKEQKYNDAVEALKAGVAKNGTAKINAQDESGKTPLMEFSADGNIEACKFLLQNGAKADIKDNKGLTAIDYACTELEKSDNKLKAQIIALLKVSP